MSLTKTRHVFGSVSQTGLNNFLTVFFSTRPHLLAYGSPFFASDPTKVTPINTSSLPAFLSNLQFLIQFTIPSVDITPPDSSTELLPPGIDQLTIFTTATITLLCSDQDGGDNGRGDFHRVVATLKLAVLCRPIVANSAPGVGSIGVQLIAVKVDGIAPPEIEQMIECLLAAILNWALSQVRIPFKVFTIEGVSLTLQEGPVAQDDQIEVWGDVS